MINKGIIYEFLDNRSGFWKGPRYYKINTILFNEHETLVRISCSIGYKF